MEKQLLNKYIKGRTSDEEEQLVMEWLRADAANQKELNALWFVHNAVLANAPTPAAHESLISDGRSGKRFRENLLRRGMQAAAALLLIAGSWSISRTVTIEDAARQYLTVAAPAGQRIDITLQDGTTVCLNSGAKLEYPVRFGKTRRVKISGEAMFDVDHDERHPFVVETFACDVEVLGTRFNVYSDEAAHRFSTALLRGRLKVTGKLGNDDRIFMDANDLVCLDGNRLVLRNIENADDYLWPDGILNLVGHSFTEIISRLEHLYGVKIQIESARIPELNIIRGKIPISMGLDYALRALQRITPFAYERDEQNAIHIK